MEESKNVGGHFVLNVNSVEESVSFWELGVVSEVF